MTPVDQLLARLREEAEGKVGRAITLFDLERIITKWSKEQPAPVVDAWVPVSERLPVEGKTVLLFQKLGPLVGQRAGQSAQHYHWWFNGERLTDGSVTHWMDLPSPPKGGTP